MIRQGLVGRSVQSSRRRASAARRSLDVAELLVWVFRRQKAHLVDGRGVGLYEGEKAAAEIESYGSSADGCAAILERMRLGCAIDRLGADNGALHPDAEAVWEVVRRLPRRQESLLVRHAVLGGPPAGYDHPGARLGPVWKGLPSYDGYGRPRPGSFVVEYDRHRNAVACPLALDHELGYCEALRRDYRDWQGGLVMVAEHFRRHPAQLRDHAVTGPALPAWPWADRPQEGAAA